MPGPLRYFDLSRDMSNPFQLRLSLVSYARQHGIKAAARLFQTTVPTVRKWLRRSQAQGLHGLQSLSRSPHSWPQMQARRLPVIQYTAREVRSGLLFLAFASRRSAAASAVFAARIQRHLDRCGVDLRQLVWQTDNGSEFVGALQPDGSRSGFPAALGDSEHVRIPPAAHTYQSDVETVHRLIEDEFFDLESFRNRPEFFAKATTYQPYFNLALPNSHKDYCSPWQIIERLAPRSPLHLCLL